MYHRAPHTTFTLSPPKTKNGGAAGTEGGGYHHHHQLEAATGATMEHSTGGYSSGHSRCGSTYQQAIVEIYECLYQLQRERTHSQEAQVVDCISKWYELNAVFENPFTRASGIHAIIAQFSLMSLIPGRIWSELGDICESEDYNGNRVVVFSHTLHFDLLGSTDQIPAGAQTPFLSVPPTPFGGTPNLAGRFPGFHAAILARMAVGTGGHATLHQRLRASSQEGENGGGTTWPLRWLVSHLSPRTVGQKLARLDLKLSTRLHFNEQARIVSHEDIWGLKELLEFAAPALLAQLYSAQRWLVGQAANLLSRHYLRSEPLNNDHQDRPSNIPPEPTLHSPIFIGSRTPIHKPSLLPNTNNRPLPDDDDDDQLTEAGSLDDTRSSSLYQSLNTSYAQHTHTPQ
ncbi:hypothetical protein PCANC_07025 [Puccinia coronata f. sp. avenae]|uniref:Uncharacterized protein n=1 Tax=Puccinia coronata f. sp. avenae TaxID=200324 RepID=A0A2N5VZM8_9BASI|nr:hypothetical protein PCANC_15399 [Puccinia coronata f. sp. avenae]PLW41546.1 hypothetical protein PCASD_09979 [Puccinia coronata f. sp. avenae]PLW55417.1 hypothetical protein PCANC_07025 [Puccinia coronata f. sp. avenae]